MMLSAFAAGGTSLVWTWFAVAWSYAILAVPILVLPTVLGRRDDPALRAATCRGSTSVALSLIGFLRWVFVVPPLADAHAASGAAPLAGHHRVGSKRALQGEVLATAVPALPVWEPGGFLGSTAWGLWGIALGVTVLLRPVITSIPSSRGPADDLADSALRARRPASADAQR